MRYTFSVSPDYLSDDDVVDNVRHVEPSLDYSIELPKGTVVSVDDLYYHFDLWLRGMGYYLDNDEENGDYDWDEPEGCSSL